MLLESRKSVLKEIFYLHSKILDATLSIRVFKFRLILLCAFFKKHVRSRFAKPSAVAEVLGRVEPLFEAGAAWLCGPSGAHREGDWRKPVAFLPGRTRKQRKVESKVS